MSKKIEIMDGNQAAAYVYRGCGHLPDYTVLSDG